ncbi:hypothetical protein [Kutzneria sp. NPDC051319]|uniref:hypothetical protein n=1 Tax=Kutzneria sp. NPDC051319 TaxID=3155047 RepID=UPI0034440B6A
MPSRQTTVKQLLDRFGATYAHEAGITLRDKPAPLYQLLILATLLSARIRRRHRRLHRTGALLNRPPHPSPHA